MATTTRVSCGRPSISRLFSILGPALCPVDKYRAAPARAMLRVVSRHQRGSSCRPRARRAGLGTADFPLQAKKLLKQWAFRRGLLLARGLHAVEPDYCEGASVPS